MSAAVDTAGELSAARVRARRTTAGWSWTAILAFAASGLLHLLVAARHVDHSTAVLGFFLIVAAGQVGAAGLLFVLTRPGLRPSAGLLTAGIAGTVGLIGLYLVAQRTGLFTDLLGTSSAAAGQHAGHGDPVPAESGARDAAVLGLEVLTVVALSALLPRTWRGRVVDALCALGALTWLLWLTGVLG
ncbi:hypothetical protein [Geodermatophilus sp. URMC 64]